jgi:hypothetical protein
MVGMLVKVGGTLGVSVAVLGAVVGVGGTGVFVGGVV